MSAWDIVLIVVGVFAALGDLLWRFGGIFDKNRSERLISWAVLAICVSILIYRHGFK